MTVQVLLVEDNPDNTKLISWVLEDLGYEITHAESGEVALEMVEARGFDLVLMDVGLPGINGETATMRIREKESFAKVPIVAVTAHALPSEIERIMSAGFTSLVTKPIDEDALIVELTNLMKRE